MLESHLPAGMRGTFVPDTGAPLRAVVPVSHADGRIVLEVLGPEPGSPAMQTAYATEFAVWIQRTHPALWAAWQAGPPARGSDGN